MTIEEFQQVDIRIVEVTAAEKVPDTDKLLRLEVSLGEEKRQIVAGLALSYPDPTALIGQKIPIVANLEPRVLRGLESNGMVLAASTPDGPLVLRADDKVEPGTQVR